MIREMRLENFRCFKGATLRLGPLTALVGPNASGKTALLTALTTGIRGPRDVRQHLTTETATIAWTYDGGGTKQQQLGPPAGLAGDIRHRGQYLHLDVREMRKARQVRQEVLLTTDGSNLVNVVATLGRKKQESLAHQLCALVPVLQDMDPRPSNPGHHRLVFQDRWDDHVWYEPEEVSDGAILTLGLLAAQHQEPSPMVIAIEEPEHGLHPYLLQEIVAVFRKMSTGATGSQPIQIVLATQSAELLELLAPEEVRFLTRTSSGEVVIHEPATDTENWRHAFDAHQRSLSSLWLSGGLGGIPGE